MAAELWLHLYPAWSFSLTSLIFHISLLISSPILGPMSHLSSASWWFSLGYEPQLALLTFPPRDWQHWLRSLRCRPQCLSTPVFQYPSIPTPLHSSLWFPTSICPRFSGKGELAFENLLWLGKRRCLGPATLTCLWDRGTWIVAGNSGQQGISYKDLGPLQNEP